MASCIGHWIKLLEQNFGLRLLGSLLLLCCWCLSTQAQDQSLSNLREKKLLVNSTSTSLDTLSIVPSSIVIQNSDGTLLDTSYYKLNDQLIIWRKSISDSLLFNYRVLPFALSKPQVLLDTNLLQPIPEGITTGRLYRPGTGGDPLIDFRGLDYSGSFTRGISFGNRQDLVLNSSFNLQLAGELGDGIEVLAAITDENLPIQAEGTTQQLREFDRVYIQLRKNQSILQAGDYELNRPKGYFLNYFKKLEGLTFNTANPLGKGRLESQAGLAISRGVFRRQQIVARDGNQGPYKLQGENGERFIIVLAGTERVFIDGRPLVRGLEGDYVIDYNQGEITFTPRRLITKDSRIVVEFEYADQRYLRTLYVANTRYTSDRLELYANLYSQQDSRTATGDLPLSDEEKRLLQEAGDRVDSTLVSSINLLEEPDPQRVTYALIDTMAITCSGADSTYRILQFSIDPEISRYVARFSFVGAGQGNYILDTETAANERVFRWVAPDPLTCQPSGDYEPATRLTAPEQQQMLALGLNYRLGKSGYLRTEFAMSKLDLNRFSRLDKEDDGDWAAFVSLEQPFKLSADSSGWWLNTELTYERKQGNFQPINPYRNPEFLRNWNLSNVLGQGQVTAANEDLLGASVQLNRSRWGRLGYRFNGFLREDAYRGIRHLGQLDYRRSGWSVAGQADYLSTQEEGLESELWRPGLALSKQIKGLGGFEVGAEFAAERSERRLLETNLLNTNSFAFDRFEVFAQSPDTAKYNLRMAYQQRRDFGPRESELVQNALAREANLSGNWRASKALQMGGTLNWRQLSVLDSTFVNEQSSGETFLGQVNINLNAWKGVLRSTTNYTIGSGQEPRTEFTFLFVGPGQGQYIWLDSLYNNDGKIQPNEMEIAPFSDIADYVRVSVLTDDFVRTDNNTFNQSVSLTGPRSWRRAKGMKQFLSKLGLQSSLTINRKTRASDAVQRWNPLQLNLPDSALVSLSSTQRHALNFNRGNPNFDLQLEIDNAPRRIILTTGFESTRRREQRMRLRYKLTSALIGRLAIGRTKRTSDSEFFNNKDFQLEGVNAEPQFIWQPGQDWRLILGYRYQMEENNTESAESSQQHNFSFEASFKQQLRADLSWVEVDFMGDQRSPVAFTLLNGLQPGRNLLWNLTLTQPLSKGLQLILNYEGRKTGENPTVHVGRAQVTALF